MEKKVFFDGEFGKVCGVLHKVDNVSEIVIVVHGFSSHKGTSAVPISKRLNAIGLNALRIDLDNRGESELDFKTGITIPNYVKQVRSAIDYCKSLGYKEISLIGGSFGGITVFSTALSSKDIKRMVLRVPVVDYKRHLERRFSSKELEKFKEEGFIPYNKSNGEKLKFTVDCYLTAKDYSMFDHADKLDIPVLIVQGDEDEAVEWEFAKDVVKLFRNGKLTMIKGANHGLCVDGDYSEGLSAVVDFFKD
ncbi:MAG: alpha/beta hydrolase [Candidatus Woesearchaeota archaeon]